MFVLGDVVVHTWDLARATGLDETLDADIVHDMLVGMEPLDEMLRTSGHYGPKVAVGADADEQTRAHRLHRPATLTPRGAERSAAAAHGGRGPDADLPHSLP